MVGAAAVGGAHLVVLPEMCATGFTMETQQAEALHGPSAAALAGLAERNGIYVVAGLALRESGHCVNAALLFGPDGAVQGTYQKQRLFGPAGEDRYYVAGTKPALWRVGSLCVSPLICFDLRFAELFKAVAPFVDAFLVPANWPSSRQHHWDTLIRARAIESLAYVVAVNRVGEGGDLCYKGGSAAWDPWGEPVAASAGQPAIVELDPELVTRVRAELPLFADQRAEV